MREIKFRVFFYDGTDYRSGGMISLGEAMLEEYVVIKFDDRNTLLPFDECSILMQYTGLKDSKGVEIYEGDIVHLPKGDSDSGLTETVVFENGCFMLKDWRPLKDMDWKHWKIIGNIYEDKK